MRLRQALLECIAKRASAAQDQFLLGKLAQAAVDAAQRTVDSINPEILGSFLTSYEQDPDSVLEDERWERFLQHNEMSRSDIPEFISLARQRHQQFIEDQQNRIVEGSRGSTEEPANDTALDQPEVEDSTPEEQTQEELPTAENTGARTPPRSGTGIERTWLGGFLGSLFNREPTESSATPRSEQAAVEQPPPETPLQAQDGFYSDQEIASASDPQQRVSLMFDQFGNQYGVDRSSGEVSRRVTNPRGGVQWHRTPDLDFQVHNGQLRPTQNTQRMGMMNANPQNIAQQLGGDAFFDPRSGRYFRRDGEGNSMPVSSAEIWALQNPEQAQARQDAAARRQQRATDPVALASQVRAYQAAGADVPPSLVQQVTNLSGSQQGSYQTHLRHLTTAPDRRAMHDQQMARYDQQAAARLHYQQGRFEKDQVGRDNTQADPRLPPAITPGRTPITPGNPKAPETGSS